MSLNDHSQNGALRGEYADLVDRLRSEENWPFINDRTSALLRQAADTLERIGESPQPDGPAGCAWTPDDDGVYQTACGEAFTFIDAGPTENGMKFCCYCGGTMNEQRYDKERSEP